MKNNIGIIFLLIIFSIPAVFYLLQPGFFQSDDGEWMIIRFSAFYQALRDGQFPVRFLSRLNFGYGYPVSNFLYPGFMYLGVPLHVIGFDVVNTIKILLVGSIISSGIFTYLWLSQRFNRIESFVGGLFYIYTPYHLYNTYTRGSVGEMLALAVVPFLLWMIEKKNIFFIALGTFALLLSHNSLALLFLPLLFFYGIITQKKFYKSIILGFLLGTGLSSFFTIPAVYDLQYTAFSKTTISNYSEYFASFQLIGISTMAILALSLYTLFAKKMPHKNIFIGFFMVLTGALVLNTPQSNSIWRFLPVSLIQFPFRLLSLAILASSFLAAALLQRFEMRYKLLLVVVLIVALGYSTFPFIKPSLLFNKPVSLYETNEDTTTVKGEYRSTDAPSVAREHYKNKIEYKSGEGSIQDVFYNSKKIVFTAVANTDSSIRINTMYFPGWKAYVNSKEWKILINNKDLGQMGIVVPKGTSKIELVFTETPVRLVSNAISVISFIVLCGMYILFYKKRFLV